MHVCGFFIDYDTWCGIRIDTLYYLFNNFFFIYTCILNSKSGDYSAPSVILYRRSATLFILSNS